MPAVISLAVGAVIGVGGNRYVISNHLDLESVLAKNQETGISKIIPLRDITPVSSLSASEKQEHLELSLIDELDWKEADGWYGSLRALISDRHLTKDKVKQVADKAGVHLATVYRKLKILETHGRLSSLVKTKSDGGKGKSRLSPEVNAVVIDTIDQFYFNKEQKRRSKTETIDEVEHRLRNAELPLPHRLTIYNRILAAERTRNNSHPSDKAEFDERASPAEALGADYPLAVVQIDHTPVDIMVVDEVHRLSCGKPWLTVAIDVFSRMVLGFYLSLDPPGNTGTGQCIANSILTKELWLTGLDINISWPCWGLMDKIHADNAGEFRGHMLKRACKEYGIDLEWRPVKKPRYGAHIERLLGTFMKEIHRLPGSTESNPGKRGEYDSEKHAALTMAELEKWLTLYIVGAYHQIEHSGIQMPPIKRYEQGIFGTEQVIGRGLPLRVDDVDRLRLDLLPAFKRTIQGYGVQLDKIQYKSGVLVRWENAKDPKSPKERRKFVFKRNPRDISVLYFYDPDLKQYFKIPYRDIAYPPMSIWEYRKVRAHLKEKGLKDVNEQLIFQTFLELREMVSESTRKSKSARREEERHKANKRAKKPSALQAVPDKGAANQSGPPIPQPKRGKIKCFDEIEI